MSERVKQIRSTVNTVVQLEHEWVRKDIGHGDAKCTPWIPFPWYDFTALVAEAVTEVDGDRFLEIGAGVGTKMMLARDIFGFEVRGIECVPEYAARAREAGLDVVTADALHWDGYAGYDLVWFNRPYADADMQAKLEAKIWHDVSPGTVVIAANLEAPPPPHFYPVLDDGEVRRWIVQKM